MILVDTSIWIDHINRGFNEQLGYLLAGESVLTHDFVIGEIAMGSIKNRRGQLDFFRDLHRIATADDQEQRSALLIAPLHYCRETALDLGAAQDSADLNVSREPVACQAASSSSAPINSAASASRLRAPRSRSRVAASRVTRLMAASAFKCSAPEPAGERRRKMRSTGAPSIAL